MGKGSGVYAVTGASNEITPLLLTCVYREDGIAVEIVQADLYVVCVYKLLTHYLDISTLLLGKQQAITSYLWYQNSRFFSTVDMGHCSLLPSMQQLVYTWPELT